MARGCGSDNGSLDLIIQAFGRPGEIGRAYDAAIARVRELILELDEDLPRLQARLNPEGLAGRRAAAACASVPGALAPLTALRGAAADEVMAAMTKAGQLDRGFANNLGVVAFHLAEGQSITPAAFDWPDFPRYRADLPINATVRARGAAAAGWDFDRYAYGFVNRLHVAAPSAAVAEAGLGAIAASMLPAMPVKSVLARALAPQTILGDWPVYAPVPALSPEMVADIVARGRETAAALFAGGIVTLVLAALGAEAFLIAPPHFALRSTLRLET